MAAKINKNRYRLITLLYVIFVCLSVLNIPFSLLDSNYYWIKTLEYQERERLLQVDFANKVIATHRDQLNKDTTLVYLNIQSRLHRSYEWVDSLDKIILKGLEKMGTNIKDEFQDKRKIEEILVKDSLIYRFKEEMFSLNSFIRSQPYQIDSAIENLLPVKDTLRTLSNKEVSWERYLFLHKPTAISYVQIKRIKLLLLENEYVYQAAALKTIDYLPAFFSRKENRVFIDKKVDEQVQLQKKPEVKEIKPVLPVNKLSSAVSEPAAPAKKTKDNEYDNLFQQIIGAMYAENLYVGVSNTFLREIDETTRRGFSVSIDPTADISQSGNNYTVIFRKSGDFTFRFTDTRNNSEKLLFEKKVHVSLLPNPTVKLNIDNATKDVLSVKDLLTLNRMITTVDIGSQLIPGRLNGFRFTRIPKTGEQRSVYNYGEIFRGPMQELIGQLQKGDVVFFDNITISLTDGTTRTPNPILYKIVE